MRMSMNRTLPDLPFACPGRSGYEIRVAGDRVVANLEPRVSPALCQRRPTADKELEKLWARDWVVAGRSPGNADSLLACHAISPPPRWGGKDSGNKIENAAV